jgi:ABC-type lipopolysaccharide export system ATPase subunit
MSSGDITVEGDAKDLLSSDEIKKAYLGENTNE